MFQMQEVFDEMVKKTQTLSSWSREQIDSVNRLKGAWERLLSLIDSHHLIIEKQMENVKMTLGVESENLIKELEHFSAKWELNRPKSSGDFVDSSIDGLGKLIDELQARKNEWGEIVTKKEKLLLVFLLKLLICC